MNGRRTMAIGLAIVLGCLSLGAVPGSETRGQKIMHKLGRAVTNIAAGWIEIFREVHFTVQEKDMATGLTLGLLRGVGVGVVRTVAGAFELVTFPFPVPRPDYEPILAPEFVFDAARTDVGQFSTKR